MNDHNIYPIAPVLAEADNLATMATRLLEAADELEKAQLAAHKDGTTTNTAILEHAKALHHDRAADLRYTIEVYSKRIEIYRNADGRDTRLIAAANAALHYIAAIHGAEVPMQPFEADLTAAALAGALNPYKTPYGREIDNKMASAISTAKQASRVERECGCGWRGRPEDCLRCGEVGPLCPECRETTEEAEQKQTAPANQQRAGVYRKFNVSRTDGRDLPGGDRHGAEYFVLDVTHDKFAKPALAAYAAVCRNDYPALADDMVRRYGFDQQQAEPVAWVRFCSDGCYEGPLMNSSPAMDGARRTSGAWTPLFAAQPVARDVLMMALQRLANEVIKFVPGGSIVDPQQICDGIRQIDLATIADHYAARLPVEMHSTDLNDRKAAEIIQTQGFTATGYVLTGQDGRYALCNGGAVRWLDKAEYQHTMFLEGEHSPVPVPSCPNQYGLDTPYFARWLNRVIKKMDYYRPDDFARELGRMAAAADKTALLQDQLSGAVAQKGTDQ